MNPVDERFLGLGLRNIFLLWIIIVLLTVGAKVVFTKYPVKGVTEIINTV